MNTATHTPTPWRVDEYVGTNIYGPAQTDSVGISIFSGNDLGRARADAAFIVRACNSHDELVAALER